MIFSFSAEINDLQQYLPPSRKPS